MKNFSENLNLRMATSLVFVCLILATSGCAQIDAIKKIFLGKLDSPKAVSPGADKPIDPQKITYFEAKRGRISDVREIRGKLQASEKVELRADKRMRIGPAKFKLYSKVKKGDIIFPVDTKDLEAKKVESKERVDQLKVDIKAAIAQLEFAQKQLERKQSLVKKGIAAQKELDEAQKQFVAADTQQKTRELELRKAERELSNAIDTVAKASIISPLDGIITAIIPGGNEVNQSESMATIANPASLSLYVKVDEATVTLLKPGFKVVVRLDALPRTSIDGVVKTSVATVNQQGIMKTYEIQVDLSQNEVKKLNLRDGYEGVLYANFGERLNTIKVPIGTIRASGDQSFILVATSKGSVPSARAVKIGMRTELEVEVLEGLRGGEFVVAYPSEGNGR